jgi:uncharacterized membrane protein YfcA
MTQLELIFLILVTLLVSTLTLLTGFGVGTILTPAFALMYDVKTAVMLVSVIHLLNNLLKLGMFYRSIKAKVFWRFGLISIFGAFIGSSLQGTAATDTVQLTLAVFLLIIGAAEFAPKSWSLRLPRNIDILGGFFSGFTGGLIGNQGAIRSAYLLNYDLKKEEFIGTATAIAVVIDLTRIPVYIVDQFQEIQAAWPPLLVISVAAFGGTLVGKRLLSKISLERFRSIVALFVIAFGGYLLFRLF